MARYLQLVKLVFKNSLNILAESQQQTALELIEKTLSEKWNNASDKQCSMVDRATVLLMENVSF